MFQNEDMSCKESTEKLLPYGPPPRRIWPLMHAGRDFAAPRGAAFPPGYSTQNLSETPARFRELLSYVFRTTFLRTECFCQTRRWPVLFMPAAV